MKALIALAAATGVTALSQGVIAAPLHVPNPAVQKANWYAGQGYCGPECRYWRHRRWEREHAWRYRHSYGYNYGHHQSYYYRGY